jgi:hypothetical protein
MSPFAWACESAGKIAGAGGAETAMPASKPLRNSRSERIATVRTRVFFPALVSAPEAAVPD